MLGPCGGKTTSQERLAVFFENLGWQVINFYCRILDLFLSCRCSDRRKQLQYFFGIRKTGPLIINIFADILQRRNQIQ